MKTPQYGFVSFMYSLCARSSLLKEIELKKRNTDGVVPHKPYAKPG